MSPTKYFSHIKPQHGLVFVLFVLVSSFGLVSVQGQTEDDRPNFIFIISDDMGYSDLGSYGAEINTPHLDELLNEGLMFTNFHTHPTCSPTRASLLTGVDNHRAGVGTMFGTLVATPHQQGNPSYTGNMSLNSVTVMNLLKDSGYHTYMSGKWHLGGRPDLRPDARGFEQSFVLQQGGASHFADLAAYDTPFVLADYFMNGEPFSDQIPDDFYSTEYFVDTMIDFIDGNAGDGQPFMGYLALTAPHAPLQVPDEWLDRYDGVYDEGYDVLRRERFDRMIEMGLIPDYVEYPERWDFIPAWDELSPEEQAFAIRDMELYAAMIEYMDLKVGDLVEYLKSIDEYEDTVFIYFTDNGADYHDRMGTLGFAWTETHPDYDNSLENLGRIYSYDSLHPGWAQVSATPLYGAKGTVAEGGIRGQLIMTYPAGFEGGRRVDGFASVTDMTPTLLDYAGVTHPAEGAETGMYGDREVQNMDGRSMRPMLEGEVEMIYGPDEGIGFEMYGGTNKALYMGDWKILRLGSRPWGAGSMAEWQLFNLAIDPTEQQDLSEIYPERLEMMIAAYEEYEEYVGFVPNRPEPISFTDDAWEFDAQEAEIVEAYGRESLYLRAGTATFTDANFAEGVVNFDMLIESTDLTAGIQVHQQDAGNYERFGLVPDEAFTFYHPVLNGLDTDQLYYGIHYENAIDLPLNEWIDVQVAVTNDRAGLYVMDFNVPYFINDLHGRFTTGDLALFVDDVAPFNGVYFSNFTYAESAFDGYFNEYGYGSFPEEGIITDWEVSAPFTEGMLDDMLALSDDFAADLEFSPLETDPRGILNIGQRYGLDEGNTVFARTIISVEEAETASLTLAYSDRAAVYLNGQLIFAGDNTSEGADDAGLLSLDDEIFLALEAGDNELIVAISETEGGWGLQAVLD